MKKPFFTLLALCLFATFTACKKREVTPSLDSFDTWMGKGKKGWEFVETTKDLEILERYKAIYALEKESVEDVNRIPKVIHFIWVGPNDFPKESIKNIRSWVKHHPDWSINFWTDRERFLPHPNMELKLVQDFTFTKLENCFKESDNYAEKSDLLRYEILHKEGGLYVDHDVECFASFDSLHKNYDLYCGIEPSHEPLYDTSISVCNNIIGVIPNHPILQSSIDMVFEKWEEIGKSFPGKDKESIIYRVFHRSFRAFDNSVYNLAGMTGLQDMVFPAGYFNTIDGSLGKYANHQYASTWFSDETKFEKTLRRKLFTIAKKNNQILLLSSALILLQFCFIIFLAATWKKNRLL